MKRALITGITGNVGFACQDALKAAGWHVTGVSRADGLDLTDREATERFVRGCEPFGLVVMAHGTQHGIEINQSSFLKRYSEIMGNNLHSAVYLTHALLKYRKLAKGGLIVYCGSIQARQPRAGRGPYAVAKAGLEALARIVAVEGAGDGIRAVCLRLGQLDATMQGIQFDPAQLAKIKGRLLAPLVPCSEVATLILTLYRQGSITGAVWDVDSGHNLNVWPGGG